jgi:hypothetical protein
MPPEEPTEDMWLDEDAGPVVRPYAMTRGRTRPTTGEFDLISVVATARPVTSTDIGLGPEHLAIVGMCRRPLTVADLASHLDLPVGIVRVLLGDLLDKGLILVREPQSATQLPDEGLFRAVLHGLRSL